MLVLFGSRARGTARPDSDLDVAVLTRDAGEAARWRLRKELDAALAPLAPGGRVDVVFLHRAPALLRQRIMEHGRVLIGADDPAWKDLRVRTMREHGDREFVRRLYRQSLRQRLMEGRTYGRSGRALRSLERTRRLPG